MSKSLVGPVVSEGGDPFWSERLERNPLPEDGTGAGRRDAEGGSGTTGGRCVWTVTRVRGVDETANIRLEEFRTALAARHRRQATARCYASFTFHRDQITHKTRRRSAPSRIART